MVWGKELWILVPQPEVYLISPLTNCVALSELSWKTKWFYYLIIFRSLLSPDFTSGKLRSGRIDDTEKSHVKRLHTEAVLLPLFSQDVPPLPSSNYSKRLICPSHLPSSSSQPPLRPLCAVVKKNLQTCYHI